MHINFNFLFDTEVSSNL